MKSNKELNELYIASYKTMNNLIDSKLYDENEILKVIDFLQYAKKFSIFDGKEYNFDSISQLFRFFEEELKNSFEKNKERFHILFKIYLLLIELFTVLCEIFTLNKSRSKLIDPIFQHLKESKNLLKFFVPLEEKEVKILNNIIGEQLYYFSHVHYINLKDTSINYILEKTFLNCERMLHGIELSISSNFGDNPEKTKDIEEMFFANNLTFLLLRVLTKLRFHSQNEDYLDNLNFLKIFEFFNEIELLKKRFKIDWESPFYELLLNIFIASSNYIEKEKNYNCIERKLKLLQFNTDEYKELIDIISFSKQFD